MEAFRHYQCSRPHDHLYTPLGLAPVPPGVIKVDYTIMMDELYRAISEEMRRNSELIGEHDLKCILDELHLAGGHTSND